MYICTYLSIPDKISKVYTHIPLFVPGIVWAPSVLLVLDANLLGDFPWVQPAFLVFALDRQDPRAHPVTCINLNKRPRKVTEALTIVFSCGPL